MPHVFGYVTDNQTRCKHYQTTNDIVAIKFRCCHKYYPCYRCHEECEDHDITVWEKENFNEKVVLCGVCGKELTIHQYLSTNHCLNCHSSFNEGCHKHYDLYFET